MTTRIRPITAPLKRVLPPLLILSGLFLLVWLMPPLRALEGQHLMSLPVHIFAETLSIVVSMMVFGLIWSGYGRQRPLGHVLLAVAFLAVALLDFAHTLSYQGMPDLVTPAGPEKAINYWLLARLLFASAILAVALLPDQRPMVGRGRRYWLLAGALGLSGLIIWLGLYRPEIWPRTFIPGQGLTPFKIGAEYFIIALLALSALLLYRKLHRPSKDWEQDLLLAAVLITILSELAFTLYAAVTDIFNLLGHIYKVAAYLLLYRAVFISTVQTPYQQLRKMGDELLAAKENWERTFSSIGDMVIIQDPQQRIIMANCRVSQVTGLEMTELIGKHCHVVFHASSQLCPGCPISSIDELEKVGAQKGAEGACGPSGNHRAEIFHEHLGINCAVSSAPVYGPDGKLIQIITIAQDITRLKTLEGQLRQSQKMEAIGTLAGGIAHDFNNILTPILGYSDLLVKELPPENPLREPAREIHLAGLRARDLVRQILSFSRQAKQQRQPITISLIVKEALKLLRASLPSTIEIRQDIAPGDGKVLADPTSIHQVIMNLCTNAHHAMKEQGGVLAVSIKEVEVGPGDFAPELGVRPGPYLRLAVADTGYGITPEVMERLFDPYFTTKPTGEGTGLGLPVVHGIVKDLGGQIKVYSEVEKGATFIILLPRYRGEENEQAAAAAAVDQPLPGGDERILVVDDEKPISDLLLGYLGELGYRVTTSNDPVQALELFTAAPDSFDLVISDVTMPRLNGIELAQKLLAVKPQLAIILCTGFSEAINQEKANAIGVRRLMMKPVLGQELAQALREVLKKS